MRTAIALVSTLLMVLGVNVASAQQQVSKTWSTGEQANGTIEEWWSGWAPRGQALSAYKVYDESNRYQYTQVVFRRYANSPYGQFPYIRYDRQITCILNDTGALKVSDAGAKLSEVVLDPASSDCTTSGYYLECDESWECTYDPERGIRNPVTVAGEWANPGSTTMSTSTNLYTLKVPNFDQRSSSTCRSFTGNQLAGGGLTINGLFTNFGGGAGFASYGDFYRTQCQTTGLNK